MKTPLLALMAAMALTLCESQLAVAQWVPQYGNITQGMFGYRVVGRPIIAGNQTMGMFGPRAIGLPIAGPSNYSNNLLISPNGFLMYNNQYYGYQVNTPFSAQGVGYIPVIPNTSEINNTTVNNPPIAETNMMQGVGLTEQGYPVNPGATPENTPPGYTPAGATSGGAQQGTNFGAATEGMNPGAAQQSATPGATPAAVNAAPQRAKFYTASVLSTRRQPFTRSPELSNRLTSIARNRDMLVGKDINVYLSNDVALVQGTVRTPADSAMLASVLGLEPDVEHIDNRLSVAAMGN